MHTVGVSKASHHRLRQIKVLSVSASHVVLVGSVPPAVEKAG